VPVMTESDALPPGYAESDDPRRLVLADLVGQLAARVATQARAYEEAARVGPSEPLHPTLEALARAKQAQAADLAPLGRALGAPTAPPSAPPPPDTPPRWGVILGEAFQGERELEALAQELARLAPDPAVGTLAGRLAAGAHRDGEAVRRLYLRYS
jgi:hypothetical protein